VVAAVVAGLRVHDLGRALAGETARDGADGGAGRHADRASSRADPGAGHRPRRRADTRADDVLAAMLLPARLEVARVFVGTRLDAHQDAAVLDALFVVLDALFGNAGADQRADQTTGNSARARAGEPCGQRPGDDQPEARNDARGADRRDRGQRRTDRAADAGTDAGAFGRLAAELGLRSGVGQEVTLARVVAHHEVDVVPA
jgi:hypothetical protein